MVCVVYSSERVQCIFRIGLSKIHVFNLKTESMKFFGCIEKNTISLLGFISAFVTLYFCDILGLIQMNIESLKPDTVKPLIS